MKIAEYKQIDVEVKKDIIHHEAEYDEEGNLIAEAYDEEVIKEIPVMGMVYREPTTVELAEMQKGELEEMLTFKPTSLEEKLQMLAETITEELPEGTIQGRDMNGTVQLPVKIGYKWVKKLVGTTIVYESVADPEAIGTAENPIVYTDECPLLDNAFYFKDGKTVVYMSGEFIEM